MRGFYIFFLGPLSSSFPLFLTGLVDMDPSEQFSKSVNNGRDTSPPHHPVPSPRGKPQSPHQRPMEQTQDTSAADYHSPVHSRTPSIPSNTSGK